MTKSIQQIYDNAKEIIGNGADSCWGKWCNKLSKITISSAIITGAIMPMYNQAIATQNHIGNALLDDKINSQLYQIKYNNHDILFNTLKNITADNELSQYLHNIVLENNIKIKCENIETAAYDFIAKEIILNKNAVKISMLSDLLDNTNTSKSQKNKILTTIRDTYFQGISLQDVKKEANKIKSFLAVSLVHEESHYLDDLHLNIDMKKLNPKAILLTSLISEFNSRITEGIFGFEKGGEYWNKNKEKMPETSIKIIDYAKNNGFTLGNKIPKEHKFNIEKMLFDSFMNDNLLYELGKTTKNSYKISSLDAYRRMYLLKGIDRINKPECNVNIELKEIFKAFKMEKFYKPQLEYLLLPNKQDLRMTKYIVSEDKIKAFLKIVPTMEAAKKNQEQKQTAIRNNVNSFTVK